MPALAPEPVTGHSCLEPSDPPPVGADPPAAPSTWSRVLHAVLDPRTIRALLSLGGALGVIGGVVWLVSLGVFDDARVLAACLAAGTGVVLAAGWAVTLHTRYRLAGIALTFLGCVVAPLNLWFLHAQDLVTVEGGLWRLGLVCCGLYAATVLVLRDRNFLYAFQAGVVLTGTLLLADLGLLTEPVTAAAALAVLGFLTVSAERAFPRRSSPEDHAEFRRDRWGTPLLAGGGVLLTAAAAVLGAAEVLAAVGEREVGGTLLRGRLWAAGVWLLIANGFVSLDLFTRDRRPAEDGPLRWWGVIAAAAAASGLAAVGNLLEHVGVPDRWDAAAFAACGVGLLAVSRAVGVDSRPVTRGEDVEEQEVHGRGATAFRCGTAVAAFAGLAAGLRGLTVLAAQPAWGDPAALASAAGLLGLAAVLSPLAGYRNLHLTLAAGVAAVAGLQANVLLDVPPWRKLEGLSVAVGLALVAAAHAGRFRERRPGQSWETTFGLWVGTGLALAPALLTALCLRATTGRSPLDEFVLVAAALGCLTAGLTARTLAPTLGGGGALAVFLLVVIASVIRRPEVGTGMALTAGGAALFGVGLVLSVCRDRLLTLPRRVADREGVFEVLDWR